MLVYFKSHIVSNFWGQYLETANAWSKFLIFQRSHWFDLTCPATNRKLHPKQPHPLKAKKTFQTMSTWGSKLMLTKQIIMTQQHPTETSTFWKSQRFGRSYSCSRFWCWWATLQHWWFRTLRSRCQKKRGAVARHKPNRGDGVGGGPIFDIHVFCTVSCIFSKPQIPRIRP